MASSQITLTNEADESINYDLVGQSETSATFKDVTRELQVPRELRVSNKLAAPGSKANSKVNVKLTDVVKNASTGVTSTGSVSVVMSIPADDAWTNQMSEDLLIQLASLLTDANAIKLADGLVP